MSWIADLEASTREIERAETLEQSKPWIELRSRLCSVLPSSLGPGEIERLERERDRGAAALERLRRDAALLREQLSECHRSGQMVRALAPREAFEPQECDFRG